MLVTLWCLSNKFWYMARFINKSLVSPFKAQARYTCREGFLLNFLLRGQFFIRLKFFLWLSIYSTGYLQLRKRSF